MQNLLSILFRCRFSRFGYSGKLVVGVAAQATITVAVIREKPYVMSVRFICAPPFVVGFFAMRECKAITGPLSSTLYPACLTLRRSDI